MDGWIAERRADQPPALKNNKLLGASDNSATKNCGQTMHYVNGVLVRSKR